VLSYALVVEELGRADSSVRGIVSVSNGLYGKTVARSGNDEQRRTLLPPLARGEALGCYALTEPGVGSDPGSLVTRAERDGDGWVLSGQKIFITLGTWAAFALVFARTGEAGSRGITCFVVPTDSPGFEARPIKGKLGLRSQDTGELFLDGAARAPGAPAFLADEQLGGRAQANREWLALRPPPLSIHNYSVVRCRTSGASLGPGGLATQVVVAVAVAAVAVEAIAVVLAIGRALAVLPGAQALVAPRQGGVHVPRAARLRVRRRYSGRSDGARAEGGGG